MSQKNLGRVGAIFFFFFFFMLKNRTLYHKNWIFWYFLEILREKTIMIQQKI